MLTTSFDSMVLAGDKSDSLIWMQGKMEFSELTLAKIGDLKQ